MKKTFGIISALARKALKIKDLDTNNDFLFI